MRTLIGIVFGCALMIGVHQAASSGVAERQAPPSTELTEEATEGALPEGEPSYECKYSPYCQSASQCERYCAGGIAECFQGCCACAS